MLGIRKTAIALDEKELLELERIIVDSDEKEALSFLKKAVYDKVSRSQQGKLKSHPHAGGNPVERFRRGLIIFSRAIPLIVFPCPGQPETQR